MGVTKKQGRRFLKNEQFLPPVTHTCVCVSGCKKRLFLGKYGLLCFLVTPALRLPLLPYFRRFTATLRCIYLVELPFRKISASKHHLSWVTFEKCNRRTLIWLTSSLLVEQSTFINILHLDCYFLLYENYLKPSTHSLSLPQSYNPWNH